MISRAECCQLQPEDRNYNAKGKERKPHYEILGGGICYALLTQQVHILLIWDEDDGKR